jgi:hypothetical protein
MHSKVALRHVVAAVVALLTGCAAPGMNIPPMQANGKYLQFKHPVAGVPAFQVALPSPEGCTGMLASMRQQQSNNALVQFWSCAANSASSSLPTRATFRNKTYAFLFDVEAISMEECKSAVEGLLNSEGKNNLEVVSSCTAK